MRDDIRAEIVRRLTRDYEMRAQGHWLRQGKCPQCGRRELFIDANTPWMLKCGRENNCAWTAGTKDLYPEEFGKFAERFPPTTADPTATADAYMASCRGMDLSRIRGWYRQGHFSHPRGDRTTPTVVFDIPGAGEAGAFMERLIEAVRIPDKDGRVELRKANFEGEYKGLWWQPPGMTIANGDELWLVEGCIDACTLHQIGLKAVATLSAGNYPQIALERLGAKVTLVWALDNDAAGTSFTRKHVLTARKAGFTCQAALCPQTRGSRKKADWNDLLLGGGFTDTEEKPKQRQDTLDKARHLGNLLLAESADGKAMIIWRRNRAATFSFEHRSRTYWFEAPPPAVAMLVTELRLTNPDAERDELEAEAVERVCRISEIANCSLSFLYFQRDKLTDESWYYTRVDFPHGAHKTKSTFTGAQIATASEFKKRLLSIAPGALFSGTTNQLNWIVRRHIDRIKIVETIEFIGYSREHRVYVFPQVAVAAGKTYPLNDEDFFEIDSRLSIKSLNGSLHLHIGTAREYRADWIDLMWQAWGATAIVGVAYFLGSLFAEQIREHAKSYPFFEISGEPDAGKTTMIEILWKLLGRADHEGIDPSKASFSGLARTFGQTANFPIVLIEASRTGEGGATKKYDWQELLTAYNGRSVRTTGVKNTGTDTYDPPFRGSIVIAQNDSVDASEAILTRIVAVHLGRATQTAASKLAADAATALPIEAVSHFLLLATTAENRVMEIFRRRATHHEAQLRAMPEIRTNRIAKCHGQIMAMVEALAELTNLDRGRVEATLDALRRAAVERQQRIASDPEIVESFWEIVDYLGIDAVNHARASENILAINLNHVQALAIQANQPMPDLGELKKHLRSGRAHKLLATNRVVNSGIRNQSVKCWIFERGAC